MPAYVLYFTLFTNLMGYVIVLVAYKDVVLGAICYFVHRKDALSWESLLLSKLQAAISLI